MRLLAAAGDIASTIAGIRLVAPLTACAEAGGHELRQRSFHDCAAADLEWADVLIVQRALSRRAWALQQAMRRSGGVVVHEIDDLLTEMPAHLVQAAHVAAQLPWLERSLADADVVAVTTARLGQALSSRVKRWVVVPNHGAGELTAPRLAGTAPTSLLFISSDRVPVAAVSAALQRLRAETLPPWQVLAIGPVADDLVAQGVALKHQPLMPRDQFARWLRSLPGAVAVIPVGDTAFDRCKSAIKFFDHALAGVPVVCADRPPYSDAVRNAETGLLVADEPDGWAVALRRLLLDPSLGTGLARAAATEVLAHHRLAHSAAAWCDLLTTLPARRRPATAALPPWQRAVEGVSMALRRANRARLTRRAAR